MILAPRANPHLLGHRAAEAALVRAVRSGRLHHGWLIVGPRGVGKATLAYRFARWLLAGAPAGLEDTLDLPEDDPTFRHVAAGSHPDLLTIERETSEQTGRRRTEIVVDDVRGMAAFLHLTSARSAWRVVVVDAADDMNVHAANAALKLLEEPPEQAILLLVSHAPTRLLPTLRSRCRRLALRPLPDADVERFVASRVPEPGDPGTLVALAEGCPGRALRLAEEGAVDLLHEVEALLARADADVPARHDLAERLARAGGEETTGLGFRLLLQSAERRLHATPAPTPRAGDALAAAWERVGRLQRQTDGLRLDRKQALLIALDALAAATAPPRESPSPRGRG
jgi:DNA polymerase-3 subunit delta'